MFSVKSAGIEGTVKSMEQKTRVFCKIDVQEFHHQKTNTEKELGRKDIQL